MAIVDENSNIPLYIQLKKSIKDQIINGSIKLGDKIPTERELCNLYGVSRITVRQAINNLEQEGFLYRKQGKGTYVTYPRTGFQQQLSVTRNLSVRTIKVLSEEIMEIGHKPSSKVISTNTETANEKVAGKLLLPPFNRKIHKILRVRLADNEPIILEKTYISFHLCPIIGKEELENGSLYRILIDKLHLPLDHANITYQAVLVGKDASKHLKCPIGSPAIFIERLTFLKNGIPIELSLGVARADRFKLSEQAKINPKGSFREEVRVFLEKE